MTAATAPPTSSKPYILYTSKLCPYAQRAELAFHETTEADNVERVEVDILRPRDPWYLEKVNPVGKVPALELTGTAGGEKAVIPESLVIANFVAEAIPSSGLLSADPVQRARVRYVIERAAQILQPHYPSALIKRDEESVSGLFNALEELDKLLNTVSSSGPFVFGDKLNLADIAIAPFVARILITSDPKLGIVDNAVFSPSVPERFNTELPRLKAFLEAVKARPSWTKTFDEEYVATVSKERFTSWHNKK
ncbi:hypothetical protein OC835_003631 [Tilletia horrida]|nr:hypothetical protein OC835_003631 [Tilletia horrida]